MTQKEPPATPHKKGQTQEPAPESQVHTHRNKASGQILHARNVFPDDVKLDVHNRSHLDVLEVGMLKGVGNDAHLKGVRCGTAHGKAYAIDGYAPLVHGEIAMRHVCGLHRIAEGKLETSLLVLHIGADGGAVNMPLHNVSVQPAVHEHGALHVHLVTHLKQAEIGAVERLSHGGYGIVVALNPHYSQTHSVVRHALVNGQFVHEGAG